MVLIISEYSDQTTIHVINWLKFFEASYIRINTEEAIHLISVQISNRRTEVFFRINGKIIKLSKIKAVWCRRGYLNLKNTFSSSVIKNKLPELYSQIIDHLRLEKIDLIEFIGSLFEEKLCINSFNKYSVNKLCALKYASDVGLKIPTSLISTRKSQLNNKKRIITKSIHDNPIFFDKINKHQYYNLTREVNLNDIKDDNYFFTLTQNKIKKKIEIRTFFLLNTFYSLAIFSQSNEKTRIDYRNYDTKNQNKNCPYELPRSIENKLRKLMSKLGLNSGSIDIILGNDNQYYFLEVNPVGQFGGLSHTCNYKIEKEIAKILSSYEH